MDFTLDQAAAVLGLSRRRVQQLITSGRLGREGRRITAAEIAAYTKGTGGRGELRLIKAKVRRAEQKLADLQDEAIEASVFAELRPLWIAEVRTRVLALADVLPPQLADVDATAVCHGLMREAVHGALDNMASEPFAQQLESVEVTEPEEPESPEDAVTVADWRERGKLAAARLIETRENIRTGKLIPLDRAEREWSDIFLRVRAQLLSLPTALAPLIAVEADPAVIRGLLLGALEKALAELTA